MHGANKGGRRRPSRVHATWAATFRGGTTFADRQAVQSLSPCWGVRISGGGPFTRWCGPGPTRLRPRQQVAEQLPEHFHAAGRPLRRHREDQGHAAPHLIHLICCRRRALHGCRRASGAAAAAAVRRSRAGCSGPRGGGPFSGAAAGGAAAGAAFKVRLLNGIERRSAALDMGVQDEVAGGGRRGGRIPNLARTVNNLCQHAGTCEEYPGISSMQQARGCEHVAVSMWL